MQKLLAPCLAFLITGLFSVAIAQEVVDGQFPTIKMKTFDGDKFVFPDGMQGSELNVVFLGMSATQENGEWQQKKLLEIQAALDEQDVFSQQVMSYHFPAMPSPPFFVKGIIAGAMADSYEGKVPLDQAGVMYLDDLDEFAGESGLALDEQPTIVIADASGQPLQVFKGELSDELVAGLLVAIRGPQDEIQDDASVEMPGMDQVEDSEAELVK